MKRAQLFSILAIAAVVLTACGSPAPAAEPTAPPEPTMAPTQAPADPTAPPADAPTEASAAPASTRVEVILKDNTVSSNLTTFQAGVPYTFVISNAGRREHNFNITPPVSAVGSIDAALAAALMSVDDTQLPPGGSASVEFTFPASAVGADLEFNCLIRRHYDDGMRLQITVTG